MPDLVTPGTIVGGRYRLVRELARGGMASVWEAEDSTLSRRVAVKILDPRLGVDDSARTRFRREATAAARVIHPGIVATYDTGEDHGLAYIVMELVEGTTLRDLLDDHGPLPPARAAELAMQIADALERAHAQGIVHRDVKPGNVMVQADGRVRVTDFGIAKAAGSDRDLTRSGTVVGTARYLAPEQLDGRLVDERADVYALGLVLYEMLAGELPFGGDTEVAVALSRLTTDPPPPSRLRPDVPPALDAVVARALARDPSARLPSAAAMRTALHDAIARADVTTAGPPSGNGTGPILPDGVEAVVTRTGRRGFLVAGLLLGAGAIAGAVLLPGRSDPPDARAEARPLAVRAVSDFDPEGDNGREHPEQVDLVVDGDPATTWETERYASADFGRTKGGVGLVLELGEPGVVRTVEIDTLEEGWEATVHVAAEPSADLDGWGPVRATTGPAPGREVRVVLDPAAEGRSVLVWLTRLPPSGQLHVAEVRVGG